MPTYDRSMYPAGWESYPVVYWLPNGSTWAIPSGWESGAIVRDRRVILSPGARVRLICPEVFVDPPNTPEVTNGEHRIIQGLRVKFTQCRMTGDGAPYPLGKGVSTVSEPTGLNLNTFLRLNGTPFGGTATTGMFTAVEDSGVLPADDGNVYCWEGINYERLNSPDDTLVLQNVRIADEAMEHGVSWVEFPAPTSGDPDRKGHSGGDVVQNWRGPARYYVRNLTAVSSYQGFFMQPHQFGAPLDHELQDFERVHIKADATSGAGYLWWDTLNASSGITRTYGTGADGIYLDTSAARNSTIWEAATYSHDDPIVIGAAPEVFVPLGVLTGEPVDDPPLLDIAWVGLRVPDAAIDVAHVELQAPTEPLDLALDVAQVELAAPSSLPLLDIALVELRAPMPAGAALFYSDGSAWSVAQMWYSNGSSWQRVA